MKENNENKKSGKVKTFFKGLVEKLDKKMEEKAKSKPCCYKPTDKENNSCCS
jgi:hypothetical protein